MRTAPAFVDGYTYVPHSHPSMSAYEELNASVSIADALVDPASAFEKPSHHTSFPPDAPTVAFVHTVMRYDSALAMGSHETSTVSSENATAEMFCGAGRRGSVHVAENDISSASDGATRNERSPVPSERRSVAPVDAARSDASGVQTSPPLLADTSVNPLDDCAEQENEISETGYGY